jgi:hypothetical protein
MKLGKQPRQAYLLELSKLGFSEIMVEEDSPMGAFLKQIAMRSGSDQFQNERFLNYLV